MMVGCMYDVCMYDICMMYVCMYVCMILNIFGNIRVRNIVWLTAH
jgi:hypothetical protein